MTILDESRVNRLVGPLMKSIHDARAKSVAVLSWDSEDESRTVAAVLAAAVSRQLDRKCAVVVSEGVRPVNEDQAGFGLVVLPEYELDGDVGSKKGAALKNDYPIQFVACASFRELASGDTPKARFALAADAHLVLLPKGGVSREVSERMLETAKAKGLKLLGVVLVDVEEELPHV